MMSVSHAYSTTKRRGGFGKILYEARGSAAAEGNIISREQTILIYFEI